MDHRYIQALRSASRTNLAHYYAGGNFQRSVRKASPTTRHRLYKEQNARTRYLALANSNRRAREMANRYAANRNIEYVRRWINLSQQTYNAAKAQKWHNTNTRIYAYFPDSKKTLKRFIYHLKQHLKRLEFAKFLAGRKVAEMMMPKARANFYRTAK